MKQVWKLFMGGLLTAALVVGALRWTSRAHAEDPRVKKIDDPEISGLKTQVPLKEEMETGLKTREQELTDRERRLKEGEDRLAAEDQRIRLRITELEKLQTDIEGMQSKNRERSDEIIKKTIKTYETMNPKKASGVISIMNDALAVEILMGMKEKKAASVLEGMDPNRAMTLSSLMAKRRPAGKAIGEGQAQPQ